MSEQYTKRTLIQDAGLWKGHIDTITNEAEGYEVFEAYTNSPKEVDADYLGRFRHYREAEYEVIRAYAYDRKAY